MSPKSQATLQHELRAVGASRTEVTSLTALAAELQSLSTTETTRYTHRRSSLTLVTWLAAGGLGLIGLLIIVAQTALPGSWDFRVQQLSDNIAVTVHPSYRSSIMVKRAHQVQQLVARHATTPTVLGALAEYQTEVKHYAPVTPAGYAMFDDCQASLERAAQDAPPVQRQAIDQALQSLRSS